ncbi:hypothetical protein AAMO2058_001012300 [Amorphochlora amoebiformis]
MGYITWSLLLIALLLGLVSWYRSHLREKEEERLIEEEIEKEKASAEERKKLYRDMDKSELLKYDGKDGKPIFLAARDMIFDVTTNPDSYGPDGGYGIFAGKDASRGLGKMSLDEEDVDDRTDIKDFGSYEVETLDQWIHMFLHKYPIVGRLKDAENGAAVRQASSTVRPTGNMRGNEFW